MIKVISRALLDVLIVPSQAFCSFDKLFTHLLLKFPLKLYTSFHLLFLSSTVFFKLVYVSCCFSENPCRFSASFKNLKYRRFLFLSLPQSPFKIAWRT